MISRQSFVKELRARGYAYKDTCKSGRNEKWRKKGATHIAFVPRVDLLAPVYVANILRDCGASHEEIVAFIEANATKAK